MTTTMPRKPTVAGPLVRLHIELRWIEPSVWRRVVVPGDITLGRLHRVIQAVMGWTDSHLHEFLIAGERYGVPDPDDDFPSYRVQSEARIRLDAALGRKKTFEYIYDFGDSWEHKLRIEKALPADPLPHPTCVGGERACPPEDVGGPPGYADFLRIIQDPTDPEHEDMREWCGTDFDPDAFDIESANRRLKRIKL